MDSGLILEWYRFADTDLSLAKHALSMPSKSVTLRLCKLPDRNWSG